VKGASTEATSAFDKGHGLPRSVLAFEVVEESYGYAGCRCGRGGGGRDGGSAEEG
jgi:hypothetical protein